MDRRNIFPGPFARRNRPYVVLGKNRHRDRTVKWIDKSAASTTEAQSVTAKLFAVIWQREKAWISLNRARGPTKKFASNGFARMCAVQAFGDIGALRQWEDSARKQFPALTSPPRQRNDQPHQPCPIKC